jgi:hypothetical protein
MTNTQIASLFRGIREQANALLSMIGNRVQAWRSVFRTAIKLKIAILLYCDRAGHLYVTCILTVFFVPFVKLFVKHTTNDKIDSFTTKVRPMMF